MTHTLSRFGIAACLCLGLAGGEQMANATTTSVTADATSTLHLGGKHYRYVEATMNGTVTRADASVGSYSVGLVFCYPKDDDDANGATSVMFEGIPNYPDFDRFWQVVEKHKVNILV
jgi:hypothetical protein